MIALVSTAHFLRAATNLPEKEKSRLVTLLETLRENPFHPQLHTKRLSGKLSDCFSFRFTREYRVIFYFSDKATVRLLDVGHRKDIYR